MKKIAITFLLFLAACAHEAKNTEPVVQRSTSSAGYLDDRSLRVINLTNIQILDASGTNTFPYAVSRSRKVDAKTMTKLLAQTGDDLILSQVHTLTKKGSSTFKNIYVFITQEIKNANASQFKLNIVFENKKSGFSLVDYDIVEALQKELHVVNGPSDERENLKVVAETSFFPF